MGMSVDFPSCKGLQLTVNTMRMLDPEAEHGALRLNQPILDGGYLHDFYCLYPELNGETAEERKARLVEYALDECAGIDLGISEKRDLIEQLYDRNPYVLHMANSTLEIVARDPQQRQVIQEIAPAENGNLVLKWFGVNVIYSTATVQSPGIDISMATLSGMNAASEPKPADANGAQRFCPFCGAPPEKDDRFARTPWLGRLGAGAALALQLSCQR